MASENTLDDILVQAFKKAELIVLENISEKEMKEKHLFSDEFKDNMANLIAYEKRRTRIKNTIYYFKKAVAVLLVVLTVVFASTMSVKAWRVKLFNTIINIFEKFSEIRYEKIYEDEEKKEDDNALLAPRYIPSGFKLEKEQVSSFGIRLEYRNEEGRAVVYEQYLLEYRVMQIDTEGTELEKVIINGSEGHFLSNKGVNSIFWSNENYGFWVSSTIDREIIFKIAESIKIKK